MNILDIRNLKYNRLKPEERFLFDLYNQLVVEVASDNDQVLHYKKCDISFFKYHKNSKLLFYSYFKLFPKMTFIDNNNIETTSIINIIMSTFENKFKINILKIVMIF